MFTCYKAHCSASTCSMKHSIIMKITTPFLYPLTLQIMPIQAKDNQPIQANSSDYLKLHKNVCGYVFNALLWKD